MKIFFNKFKTPISGLDDDDDDELSSRDHCQRSLSSQISDTPRAGFELAQNLSSGFVNEAVQQR